MLKRGMLIKKQHVFDLCCVIRENKHSTSETCYRRQDTQNKCRSIAKKLSDTRPTLSDGTDRQCRTPDRHPTDSRLTPDRQPSDSCPTPFFTVRHPFLILLSRPTPDRPCVFKKLTVRQICLIPDHSHALGNGK